MEDFVLTFTNCILDNDSNQELNAVVVHTIVEKHHSGRGYFSWDGIFDDLAEIIGQDKARDILSNC